MDIFLECAQIKLMVKYYYTNNKNPLNEIDSKIITSLEELDSNNENYQKSVITLLNNFNQNLGQKLLGFNNPSNDIKASTLLNYEQKLNKLSTHNITINPLKLSINELCETIITQFKITPETLKTYLSAIMYYSKKNNINMDKLPEISDRIKSINISNGDYYRENILSQKEIDNFITWDNVILIHNDLTKQYNLDKNNFQLHTYYLMLSYYIYMPPRRILDYSNLHYDNSQELDLTKVVTLTGDIPKLKNPTMPKDEKNYYTVKDGIGYFIFNNYKTNDKYSSQYFEIHPELNNILQNYIEQNNIQQGSSILNITSAKFSSKLENIFKCYVNKSLGASGLRHIYIINKTNSGELNIGSTKDKLAYMMAHSPTTQQNYYKKTDNTVLDFVLNKNASKQLCNAMGRPKIDETPEMKKLRIKEKERKRYLKNKDKKYAKINAL